MLEIIKKGGWIQNIWHYGVSIDNIVISWTEIENIYLLSTWSVLASQ